MTRIKILNKKHSSDNKLFAPTDVPTTKTNVVEVGPFQASNIYCILGCLAKALKIKTMPQESRAFWQKYSSFGATHLVSKPARGVLGPKFLTSSVSGLPATHTSQRRFQKLLWHPRHHSLETQSHSPGAEVPSKPESQEILHLIMAKRLEALDSQKA